ncbi:hypothetical protein Y032_0549g3293 [Ancylostoma ceylanicum]|uniref:Uncharacterized protein n=1 Tax=Ancylostoma ceylanicum TaxID=53326 RepID=A0A016WQ96_9BILA|nr:hypothetical protein Y032_0549g3293 [Ancylostoma ceylanicum]
MDRSILISSEDGIRILVRRCRTFFAGTSTPLSQNLLLPSRRIGKPYPSSQRQGSVLHLTGFRKELSLWQLEALVPTYVSN